MRLNENIAISTQSVLLVPYDAHHVLHYHEWMQDPKIQEATASEPLTLPEEYANQAEWRAAPDKLTFIVCLPLPSTSSPATVTAGEADAPDRMVGDVNLFLAARGEDEDGLVAAGSSSTGEATFCNAEVDIMIAWPAHRGRGLGRAAVAALLRYVRARAPALLAEYQAPGGKKKKSGTTPRLGDLVVKIGEHNAGSLALFRGLGFAQRGGVNYFGEVLLVLEGFGEGAGVAEERLAELTSGYKEVEYDRSRLEVR
ncbi:acetyltransferase domain-containing protein [Xylariomycetidae sp. FL0641]|nr:acetyltransferase domain-containing protein [Xylariomycetidae sp. FL0641]